MGFFDLFRKKAPPPSEPPPPVPRRILVKSIDRDTVLARLTQYGRVVPPGPEVRLVVAGPLDGWTVVVPPPDLHAHWFHNLALWLAEGEVEVLALSDGAEAPFAYWLTDDDEFPDFLAGWTNDGATAVAVHVPDNQVARGIRIGLPAQPRDAALGSRGVPRWLANEPVERLPGPSHVVLTMEALGGKLNPRLVAELGSREQAATD